MKSNINPISHLHVQQAFQIQENGADQQAIAFIQANDKDGSGDLSQEELTAAGGFLGQQAMTPEETERLKLLFASVAGSNGLSAMELTQARLVMDNTIKGGDGKITTEEQQAFEQNLLQNIQGRPQMGQAINYNNLFQFGEGAGVHAKLAPSAIEKQDAVQYNVVAGEDKKSTAQLMIEHDTILSRLMAIVENMNDDGARLSNFNPGGGAAMGPDAGGQVSVLGQKLSGMIEKTATIQAQKPGGMGGILPISPSQNT
ncbi:MAG: hypothetical protein ACK551_04245 [Vampirovibrionales bacterium]